MVGPEPQLACLHGSTPRVQTERELGIVRVPISSTTMRPAIGGRRILVIGAGIAGLGAARALHDLGYEVEVVEARERLGGRICTVDRIDYGAPPARRRPTSARSRSRWASGSSSPARRPAQSIGEPCTAPTYRDSTRRHASPAYAACCRRRPSPRAGGGGSACGAPSGSSISASETSTRNSGRSASSAMQQRGLRRARQRGPDSAGAAHAPVLARRRRSPVPAGRAGARCVCRGQRAAPRLRSTQWHHHRASWGGKGDRRVRDVCRAPAHLLGLRRGAGALWAISYPVLHHFMLAYPESVFSLMRQTVRRLLLAMGRSAVPEAVCDSTAGNVVSNPFLSSRTVASSLPRPPQRQEFHADGL